MYSIEITNTAETSLQDIAFFLVEEAKLPIKQALSITDKLVDSSLTLADNPKMGVIRGKYRVLIKDSYLIIYNIDESKKQVNILNVAHSKNETAYIDYME